MHVENVSEIYYTNYLIGADVLLNNKQSSNQELPVRKLFVYMLSRRNWTMLQS